jgi:hypothetical protein
MAFTELPEAATLGRVHFHLSRYAPDGPFLMGRENGQEARLELERSLGGQRVGDEPIALDFSGIDGMSVPFADAFFVPLLSPRIVSGYREEHPVVVLAAKPDVAETLAAVMQQNNLAVVALQSQPEAELLGGDPSLRETLRVVAGMGEFSANDLGEKLGLSSPAANNRLKQLVQIGALLRVPFIPAKGGREYRYRIPRPD